MHSRRSNTEQSLHAAKADFVSGIHRVQSTAAVHLEFEDDIRACMRVTRAGQASSSHSHCGEAPRVQAHYTTRPSGSSQYVQWQPIFHIAHVPCRFGLRKGRRIDHPACLPQT